MTLACTSEDEGNNDRNPKNTIKIMEDTDG